MEGLFGGDGGGGDGGGMVLGTHGIAETAEVARIKNLFHDSVFHRCTLCDESIGNWQGHVVFVPHQGRLGIVERVMTGMAGPPEAVVERWWGHLQEARAPGTHHRIRGLSSAFGEERRKRMVYLLAFLVEHGVLRHSLKVWDARTKQFSGRSGEFERLEMIGDNIVKCVVQDRLHVAFPPEDGGLNARLNWVQQLIDSNEGLKSIFDHLQLDKIIGTPLAQSKFKSDVVECLFGELQVALWALADPAGAYTCEFDAPDAAPGVGTLRALLEHALFELTDVVLMWALEGTVRNAMPVLRKHFNPARLEAAASDAPARRRRGRRGSGLNVFRVVPGAGGSAAAAASALGAGARVSTLADFKPFVTDEPAHQAHASVVTLRGANVARQERERAAGLFALVAPPSDFAASARPEMTASAAHAAWVAVERSGLDGTAAPSGAFDAEAAARLEARAQRTAAWTMPLSAEAAAAIEAATASADAAVAEAQAGAAAGRVGAVLAELRAEHSCLLQAYATRVADVGARFDAATAAVAVALLGAGAAERSQAQAAALRPAAQPTSVAPEPEAPAAQQQQPWHCVASAFSPQRPALRPRRHVAVARPPLEAAPADGTDGGVALAPEVVAAQPVTWQLTAAPDANATAEFTAAHRRRAVPLGATARPRVAVAAASSHRRHPWAMLAAEPAAREPLDGTATGGAAVAAAAALDAVSPLGVA